MEAHTLDRHGLVVRNVYMNMVHYLKWDDVQLMEFFDQESHEETKIILLTGINTQNDQAENAEREYIYPVHISSTNVNNTLLKRIFRKISPKNWIHLGILSDDGTVVYYKLYNGLQKPKK